MRARPGHAGGVADQKGLFRIRFRADPVELALFRAGLTRWLLGLDWPATDRQDAVLAINEACDHSVQRVCLGERGEVEVVARLVIGSDDRRIVAVVRDDAGPSVHSGGAWLAIANACMERVRVKAAPGGTSVTLTSRPVPLRIDVRDHSTIGGTP